MKEVLIALKIGRRVYSITEADKFLDNGVRVTAMNQEGPFRGWHHTAVILTKKALREIAGFNKVFYTHKYGTSCKVFSLKRAAASSPDTEEKDTP